MDNRIRIRNGPQTSRITVTITADQHAHLEALARSTGFNISELVRYSLVELFKQPNIFLSATHTTRKPAAYDTSSPGEPTQEGALTH